MDIGEFFLKFFTILVTAKAAGELFARIKLPAVVGEITAGLILGPSVLGIIEPDSELRLLSLIGMLLLLFEVGVDTDIGKLLKVGGQSTLVAATGVVLPMAAGYAAGMYFGLGPAVSLFVGGTLVATSIGITLRVLKDLGLMDTMPAQLVLGAAVLDDVAGVVILALLFDFTVEGRVDLFSSVMTLVLMALFLVTAPIVSNRLTSIIDRVAAAARTPGMLSTLVVALILGLSVLAHDMGAPEMVGAFAAGLALSRKSAMNIAGHALHLRSDLISRAEEKITPIGELFIPFFFVMVGVSIDLKAVEADGRWFWVFTLTMTAIAFVTKFASCAWVKGRLADKLLVGVAMVPRGEVGIVFAQTGLNNGIFEPGIYTMMVLIVTLTTLLAPVMLRALTALYARGEPGINV